MTCWLRSGVTVVGTIDNENGGGKDDSKLWKLDDPEFLSPPSGSGPAVPPGPTLTYVLVPVEDIVLVGVNKSPQQAVPAAAAAPATTEQNPPVR